MKSHRQANEPGVGILAQIGQAALAHLDGPHRSKKGETSLQGQNDEQAKRHEVHVLPPGGRRQVLVPEHGGIDQIAGQVGKAEPQQTAHGQANESRGEFETIGKDVGQHLPRLDQRLAGDRRFGRIILDLVPMSSGHGSLIAAGRTVPFIVWFAEPPGG